MKHDPTLYEPPLMFCEISSLIGPLIGAGVSLIGGATASDTAGDAADAQVESARIAADVQREAIDFSKETFGVQKKVYDINRADLEPYRSSGAAALGTLNSLFIPGGQDVVRMTGRLNELRARRSVMDSTLNVAAPAAPAPAPVQEAAPTNALIPGSTPWWDQVKTSNQWDPGGDGGGDGGGGDGGGGGGCFPAGTPIEIADGSTVPVEHIVIGDLTRGGVVTATMQFMAQKQMYDYQGVTVSGCHAVLENGVWKRIADADGARPVDKERLKEINRVYIFDTTEHRIHVAGVIFADYSEVDEDSQAWADADMALLIGLDAQVTGGAQ